MLGFYPQIALNLSLRENFAGGGEASTCSTSAFLSDPEVYAEVLVGFRRFFLGPGIHAFLS